MKLTSTLCSVLTTVFIVISGTFSSLSLAGQISKQAEKAAEYAVNTYANAQIESLAQLVTYNTVAVDGVPSTENPVHIKFKQELKRQALALGLDFADHGYIVIIGLGDAKKRLGVITHGDIQPVNASKWQKSPFELDRTSEPGKLIARGTEDDKGPISTAMHAMKAIKDKGIKLNRRIELYVYMAEESDWGPLEAYVAANELPELNITIDAEYPIVTAEKGWGLLKFAFPKSEITDSTPYIQSFTGGFFASQIPEDAQAVIANANDKLLNKLQKASRKVTGATFDFNLDNSTLTVTAKGKTAHSSKPQEGVNAIPHLAVLLNSIGYEWPNNGAGSLVNFINDNIGLDLEGKNFGDIAYRDDFMGPMTVSPTVIKDSDKQVEVHINIRRPKGKTKQQLAKEIDSAVASWQEKSKANLIALDHYIGNPFVQENAPQSDVLLNVFKHFTGIQDAKPIAIGGGTNARLFPTAVSFGPSMPGKKYSGHTEHEFITLEQFRLNLKMYTAAFVELAK